MSAALAWGGVLLAGVLWGIGAIVAQWLIGRGMSPRSLALARFSLGLPLLWWWHLRRSRSANSGARWQSLAGGERLQVVATGAATALAVTCWFQGIAVLGAGLPTLISICLAPVIVALASVQRGYERLTNRLIVAMTMALTGVGLMVWPAGGLVLPAGYAAGVTWSIASAFAQALVVLGNARMPARLPAVTASAWGMTAACACMLAVVVPQGVTWPSAGPDWLGVGYTGVVTTSLAYLVFATSARRLTPTASIIGIMVEPLVAMLLAGWLFAQAPSVSQWAGAALLCAAVGLISRQQDAATAVSTS